ncbi:hypothetical protein EVG14_28755, partial [Klebsiella pneumoniae]
LLIARAPCVGLAGATIAPSTMALIRNMFHDPRQALADTAALLIARAPCVGLAGATIAPSTMALIRNMFHDPRQ